MLITYYEIGHLPFVLNPPGSGCKGSSLHPCTLPWNDQGNVFLCDLLAALILCFSILVCLSVTIVSLHMPIAALPRALGQEP